MQRNIILIVDNRAQEENVAETGKAAFRGSAFKGNSANYAATEVDPLELGEPCDVDEEHSLLAQLQERITALEQRIKCLERSSREDRLRRRIRRKANQISREFKVHIR